MRSVLAIDMGGTKTAIATVDDRGQVIDRSTEATEARPAYDAIRAFHERARLLDGFDAISVVGMALPAIVGRDGVVTWAAASAAGWEGTPVDSLLSAAFGLPAGAMFDGYAATLGEAIFGAGRGRSSVATLIIGTGFGAGFWSEGRVIEGRTGVAGAVGWNRWQLADGSLSEPAEAIASGTGILAEARRLGRADDYRDTRSVFDRAESGDAAAREAITRAATVAGTVAGQLINLLAPELVVWSGGVGSRPDFSEEATVVARQSCQPYASARTHFTNSSLGAESSLVGAAAKGLSIAGGEVPG